MIILISCILGFVIGVYHEDILKLIKNILKPSNHLLLEPHEIFPQLLEWEIDDDVYLDDRCYHKDHYKYLGCDGKYIILKATKYNDRPNEIIKLSPNVVQKNVNRNNYINKCFTKRKSIKDENILKLQLNGNFYQEFLKIQLEQSKEIYKTLLEENRKTL